MWNELKMKRLEYLKIREKLFNLILQISRILYNIC